MVVLLLVVQNLAYQRKMQSLTDSYAMLQSQLSSTTADLSTRMDELQDAVRQGKSTVLEWRWVPVDKLHRDVQSSWMPVLVQVTPSESTTGMTASARSPTATPPSCTIWACWPGTSTRRSWCLPWARPTT